MRRRGGGARSEAIPRYYLSEETSASTRRRKLPSKLPRPLRDHKETKERPAVNSRFRAKGDNKKRAGYGGGNGREGKRTLGHPGLLRFFEEEEGRGGGAGLSSAGAFMTISARRRALLRALRKVRPRTLTARREFSSSRSRVAIPIRAVRRRAIYGPLSGD